MTDADLIDLKWTTPTNGMPRNKELMTRHRYRTWLCLSIKSDLSELPGDPVEYEATITGEFDEGPFPTGQGSEAQARRLGDAHPE